MSSSYHHPSTQIQLQTTTKSPKTPTQNETSNSTIPTQNPPIFRLFFFFLPIHTNQPPETQLEPPFSFQNRHCWRAFDEPVLPVPSPFPFFFLYFCLFRRYSDKSKLCLAATLSSGELVRSPHTLEPNLSQSRPRTTKLRRAGYVAREPNNHGKLCFPYFYFILVIY
uniref:Putative ovule protein n=1 Tax=Solanum chacoense TaxID=4108 RepID=A0A0V0HKH2_SOLCH